MDTARVWNPEAVDIFGPDYLALQIHVIHNVDAISNSSISLEQATALISEGFQITTGGHRLFVNCLKQLSNFDHVLAVELKNGLTDDISTAVPPPPTRSPSMNSPTSAPAMAATTIPTRFSDETPTRGPENSLSRPPTISQITSSPPSISTGEAPDPQPNGERPSGNLNRNDDASPDLRAAIGGAIAVFLVTILCICCAWRQIVKRKSKQSKPSFALSTEDGQLSTIDPKDMIPGFVELDQRSLAETTLGEQTAGGFQRQAQGEGVVLKPKITLRTGSFEDNSTYVTPRLTGRGDDDSLSYSQSHHGQYALAHHSTRVADHARTNVSNLSHRPTTYSVSSSDPPSSIHESADVMSYAESSAATDLISENRVGTRTPDHLRSNSMRTTRHDSSLRVNILTNVKKMSEGSVDEGGSSAYEMDTWSCDYDEFDRDPDYGTREARSRSPSHSSRSTAKVKNLSSSPVVVKNGPIHDVKKALRSESVLDGRNVEKSPPDPPEHGLPKTWSHWSLMIEEGSVPGRPGTEKTISSPLSRLVDSVTQVVSSPLLSSPRSIPVVTPEENESEMDYPPVLTWSKEEDSTLIGLGLKDEGSASSTSTEISPNPWLFEKLEESLGPRSISADMESLSGRSNISTKSPSHRSRTTSGGGGGGGGSNTARSVGSKRSHHSGFDSSLFTPRTLEHDLKRLEKQLEALDQEVLIATTTTATAATAMDRTDHNSDPNSPTKASVVSMRSSSKDTNCKSKTLVVIVPPGKLGVILANRQDGNGTVVAKIRQSSPCQYLLSPGDKLIRVDEEDVTHMAVGDITALMASRSSKVRRLTVISTP